MPFRSDEPIRPTPASREAWLAGGGEMGKLIRSKDWSATPLGPVDSWPPSLRTTVSLCLASNFPISLAWGPQRTQIYNDGYWPICGDKHPRSMGQDFKECWFSAWPAIGDAFERASRGETAFLVNQRMFLDRHGYLEETFFTFSFSPILDETGAVAGLFHPVTELTQQTLAERRLQVLRSLAEQASDAKTVAAACELIPRALAEHALDVPFALLYLLDADARVASLAGTTGIWSGPAAAPPMLTLDAPGEDSWPLAEAARESRVLTVTDVARRFPGLAAGPYDEAPHTACVLPIALSGLEHPFALLVAGVSARRVLDAAYSTFYVMLREGVTNVLTNARAYEEERRRAEALAEIDRAKTAFFSNVSHEFRTPLTLMLGPLEDLLQRPAAALEPDVREQLEIAHRNALRLLKLVNSLLDFSRIEAGRIQACYEPTDLATYTAELASVFRSAVERAGLRLVVHCPPLPDPVFVDREMWEKVVLNLLSNAFKFTFEGEIEVSLRPAGDRVELSVRDTGTGIAEAELPHLFERFYRVKNARGRTFEGSGIGLALVQELVALHGGTVRVESAPDQGSRFVVAIPRGARHLPADRVGAARTLASTGIRGEAYLEEALRWLPESGEAIAPAALAPAAAALAPARGAPVPRILLADDNADMREYVRRLLQDRYTVEAVPDGATALARARRVRPDLVITDVMMPGLDGFGVLAALRQDEALRRVPVIMLSARAGEEATLEGLHAGADDYLVKPFSARELIARVDAQLLRAHVRAIEEAHARRLASVFLQTPVAVALLSGPSHVVDFVNPSWEALVGARGVVGRPIADVLPRLGRFELAPLLDRVYASGEPWRGQSEVSDGGTGEEPLERYISLVCQPLRGDANRIEGVAMVAHDVTQLTRARQEAESASRAKDEFLAMLGHELRNPLAPILTALQLLRLRGVDGAERERQVIERQIRHVVTLVDDLLDVSRITRGKVQLACARIELASAVAKAVETASPLLEQQQHRLRVDVPVRGLAVHADLDRLAQVVANLLTNAAKYTAPGGDVTVTAAREGDDIVLRVRDTGIGIAPDVLPRVFDLFVQAGQALDRAQGGLGLGLAIVRNLVTLHGGTVEARSEGPGRGAEFIVRLPHATETALAVRPPDPEPALVPLAARVQRLLIVDDNRDAAVMLAESLRTLGYIVECAHDAPSALRVAEAFAPEVALLDIGLPVMDGYELARRLRASERTRATRLLALTGYGQVRDRERAAAAGFSAHIVKPVDLGQLRLALDGAAEA